MKCDFLVEFDKICFHEHTCEIFPHSELKWPSYMLPNMRNRASSDFACLADSLLWRHVRTCDEARLRCAVPEAGCLDWV